MVDLRFVHGEAPQLRSFISVDRSRLKKYEGVYRFESGSTLHIKADEFSIEGEKPSGQLMVGAQGQQAIDLIFSGNETAGLTKLSLDLNIKTKTYVETLSKNDLAFLKTILPEGVSPESAVQRWKSAVNTSGELESLEVLGSSPLNQTGFQTFVRLNFRKSGGGVYHVTWRNQKLHNQDEDSLQHEIAPFLKKIHGRVSPDHSLHSAIRKQFRSIRSVQRQNDEIQVRTGRKVGVRN